MVVHVLEENSSRTVSLSLQNISTLLVDWRWKGMNRKLLLICNKKRKDIHQMQDTLFVFLQPTFEHISSSKQYKNKKERRF
jgi:hypothetical protein